MVFVNELIGAKVSVMLVGTEHNKKYLFSFFEVSQFTKTVRSAWGTSVISRYHVILIA